MTVLADNLGKFRKSSSSRTMIGQFKLKFRPLYQVILTKVYEGLVPQYQLEYASKDERDRTGYHQMKVEALWFLELWLVGLIAHYSS